MRYRALVLLSILLSCVPLFGQRVTRIFTPPDDLGLRFDVNESPLLGIPLVAGGEVNFSPNVVYTPDSSRAFVSYPGSTSVVAFDPVTGDALGMIEVGTNPTLLSLTPDGTRLAVASIFLRNNIPVPGRNFRGERIGRISIINVETLAVQTLNLQEVFFSVANNIVFSADSRTGFIASAGTDQILRFDVETAQEITPRLQLEGGTRPTTLTMAPDFSYFAAVLVGSSALPELETPDSIQLIDPGAFSILRAIVPPPVSVTRQDGTMVQVPHRLFATNTLAISSDGRFGLIGDQENSSSSPIPELAVDHALLLDMQSGEVLNVFSIGGGAGAARYSEQAQRFVMVSAVDVSFIDPEERTQNRSGSSQSSFRATSRPVFSPDGRRVLIASPVLDQINVYDIRTASLRNVVQVGLDFESEIPSLTAAPQDLAFSPDGSTLAVVNFNANTVELLENSSRIAIPEFLSTPDLFTGVALSNNGASRASIIAGGVARTGLPFSDDPATEEVVEFVNPQLIELDPDQQTAFTAAGLLEAAEGLQIQGWLDLDTNVEDLAGFFLTGDRALRRLDGGVALREPSESVAFPGIIFREGFQFELTVLNSNLNSSSGLVALISSDGEIVAQLAQVFPAGSQFTRFLFDSDPDDGVQNGIFDPTVLVEDETYYVVAAAPQGIFAYLRYFDDERMASFTGIPLLGPGVELESRLVAPQVVSFGGTQTLIGVANVSPETANVTLRLRDAAGVEIATVERELVTGASLAEKVSTLFELQDPGRVLAGWLEVETDQPGIVGSVEIQLFSGRTMTAFPMLPLAARSFVFAHVAEGLGYSTGVGLLNDRGQPANVELTVRQPDGSLVGNAQLVLEPGQRVSMLLEELVPDLPEMLGGQIQVTSDQPIFGIELFFTDDREILAVVQAQLLQGTL